MIRWFGRLVWQHPLVSVTVWWLLFGGAGWLPVNPWQARAGVVVSTLLLAGWVVAGHRWWTLHKAGRTVGPFQFVAILIREVVDRFTYRQQFRRACLAERDLRTKDDGMKGFRTPHLYKLRWQADESFTATIYPGRMGIPKGGHGFVERQESVARTLGVKEFRVKERRRQPGVFDLTLSNASWLDKPFPLAELPWGPKGTLEYGMRPDGTAATINASQSVMISGLTRRGKSVAVRVLLASIMRKQIPTELWIADPRGGVQMAEWHAQLGRLVGGCIRVRRYEVDPGDPKGATKDSPGVAGMMHEVVEEMGRRYDSMRGKTTQHVPTEAEPQIIVIFDESIPLYPILLEGHKGPAGKIAFQGAGACCSLWLLTQAADKVVMGTIRDLIPQRLAFATKTWQQTEMALGQDAHTSGALCHTLGDRVGVGYSGAEWDAGYEMFRTPMVTDAESRQVAKGNLPDGFCEPPAAGRPDVVYAAEGVRRFETGTVGPILLYVGRAPKDRLNARIREHKAEPGVRGEEWRSLVWRIRVVSEHPSEAAGRAAELAAIDGMGPYWNIIGNGGNQLYPAGEPVTLVPAPTRKSRRDDRRRPVAEVDEDRSEPDGYAVHYGDE